MTFRLDDGIWSTKIETQGEVMEGGARTRKVKFMFMCLFRLSFVLLWVMWIRIREIGRMMMISTLLLLETAC